jgi:aminoglycoside phosphotransferase (APT) family kinase protein
VRGGGLAGVIDWGDLTAGDAATDLACAWMLFDAPEERAAFFEAYEAHDAVVARAAGWAVHFGSALLDSGERRHAALGASTLRRLVEG